VNVLLTSAGRRNYLVSYFQEALKEFGGKVFAINSEENSSALWVADEFVQSPLIYDPQYPEFLLEYCLRKKVELVISLFDIELPVLSSLKPLFDSHGIRLLVGDEWLTRMANDKWETQSFLVKNDFLTVPCFLTLEDFFKAHQSEKVDFPVFVKPRWGMGSLSIYKAEDASELEFFYKLVKKEITRSALKYESKEDLENCVIIQSVMPGQEYGLDIINDLKGDYCTTIVKKKLAMRSGETDCAKVVSNKILEKLGECLGRLTGHPGNLDIDVFLDGLNAYVLELNPRFGGGYPFSHEAGVNLPKAIVGWLNNEELDLEQLLSPRMGTLSIKGIKMISRHSEATN